MAKSLLQYFAIFPTILCPGKTVADAVAINRDAASQFFDFRSCSTGASGVTSDLSAQTLAPTASTPAPTGPAPEAVYNNFGSGFCSPSGLTLDGIDDYLTITPDLYGFLLFNSTVEAILLTDQCRCSNMTDSTIVIKLNYTNTGSEQRFVEFSDGCGNDLFFLRASSSDDLKAQLDNGCGSESVGSFW